VGQFPEVAQVLTTFPVGAVLDGEITVGDASGRPDWHLLRGRAALRRGEKIMAAALEQPATYYAFDLLALAGRDLRGLPLLTERSYWLW
jgi:bifunctional non-homologous end joining protein LigD